MKRETFGMFIGLMMVAALASAQSANNASKIVFDELAQSPATATSAQYPTYRDGSATAAAALAGVTCAAAVAPLNPAADTTCQSTFPAFTPGTHTLAITQLLSGAESTKSNIVTFQFIVAVVPTNLRIVRLLTSPFTGGVFTSRGRQHMLRNVDIRDFHRVS